MGGHIGSPPESFSSKAQPSFGSRVFRISAMHPKCRIPYLVTFLSLKYSLHFDVI